ncbi:c-type cytochrome [Pseudoduganella namucuonensis]|uniref:Cytochrome subunit of sulfide dehydrogenase n=1 Tax=Pseudoduganella namucuonensis TaxID=1035707 RepID=A0A1I7LVE1_9BURK|nr:c-type cytochrome [Pseudoduganella namucuonensis]SFV13612.1 cytochrome subunit of sulfide dehydrogenase [Pseudoduganella namucuonensis]
MQARLLISLLALACAAQVGAAETPPPGARLAANCAACHGTNGATLGNALPPLAGQPKETLLASLLAYKAGTRSATIMTQIAKGYTDEQLAQLAAFFAGQPVPSIKPTADAGDRPVGSVPRGTPLVLVSAGSQP